MEDKEYKNNDTFGRGLVLIIVGVIALLLTFFEVEIDWSVMTKLWPILLIIIGIGLMPINKWIRTALILILLTFGYWAYQSKASDVTKVIDTTEIISTYSGEDDE